jgi:hypothetical protein
MPLTNGSGSGSWIPSRCQPKTYFLTQFFLLIRYFLKLHIHHFSKIKSQKESQNSRNKGFSYFFCTMIEGSGSGFRAGSGSGSIPLTSGSGSGRHKNMWIRLILIRIRIRWIRIQILIRICNTEKYSLALKLTEFRTCSISKTGYAKLCRSDRIRIHKTGKISLDIQR